MILDLGHFRFVNDEVLESFSNTNLVDDMEDDDGMTNMRAYRVIFEGLLFCKRGKSDKIFTLYFSLIIKSNMMFP